MYKVEKNIPMPAIDKNGKSKYPYDVLDIGDSFLVPTKNATESRTAYNRLYGSTYRWRPKKFKIAVVDGGVRCWRRE